MTEILIQSAYIMAYLGANALALLLFGVIAAWWESIGQAFLGFLTMLIWLWLAIAGFVWFFEV